MWTCPICERDFKRKNQSHSCKTVYTIDEYIALFSKEEQAQLHDLRAIIQEAAPSAQEKISWNMPTFVQNGNIAHFALQQKYIGLHVGVTAVTAFENELSDFEYTKETIHLPHAKPLPKQLIQKIVRFNITRKTNF